MPDPLVQRLRHLLAALERDPLPPAVETKLKAALTAWERTQAAAAAPAAAPAASPPEAGPFPLTATAAVTIWCDGSCAPNPGPGGWGAILEQSGRRMEISGSAPASTNNIMEMTAAIEALRRTPEGAHAVVTTDSRYVMDGITKWVKGWKRRGWTKSDGKPVLNQGLWKELDALVQSRTVRWQWVEGHSGHPENERCDVLANAARRRA